LTRTAVNGVIPSATKDNVVTVTTLQQVITFATF